MQKCIKSSVQSHFLYDSEVVAVGVWLFMSVSLFRLCVFLRNKTEKVLFYYTSVWWMLSQFLWFQICFINSVIRDQQQCFIRGNRQNRKWKKKGIKNFTRTFYSVFLKVNDGSSKSPLHREFSRMPTCVLGAPEVPTILCTQWFLASVAPDFHGPVLPRKDLWLWEAPVVSRTRVKSCTSRFVVGRRQSTNMTRGVNSPAGDHEPPQQIWKSAKIDFLLLWWYECN